MVHASCGRRYARDKTMRQLWSTNLRTLLRRHHWCLTTMSGCCLLAECFNTQQAAACSPLQRMHIDECHLKLLVSRPRIRPALLAATCPSRGSSAGSCSACLRADLAFGLAVAAAGAYANMADVVSSTFVFIATIGVLIYMGSSRSSSSPVGLAPFLAFTGLTGASLSPLIRLAVFIDPSIVVKALVGTTAVFACFSLAALFAQRRSYLYIGGFLGSALSIMFWLGLANFLFKSNFIFDLQLYGGLLVFVGYVIFDTQLLIETADAKIRGGASPSLDARWDAIGLFQDAVAIFVRLLIILSKNSEKKEKDRRNNNGNRS